MSSDEIVFAATSHADWDKMVSTLLGGASAASLNRIDEDGLEVSALYPVDNVVDENTRHFLQMSQTTANRVRYGWDICQPIHLADLKDTTIKAANTNILTALETGASSIWLSSDMEITAVLPVLFDQVVLNAINIILDIPTDAGNILNSFQRLSGDAALSLHFTHSPTQLSAITMGLRLVDHPNVGGIFMADGWAMHNQGLTNIAELAVLLSSFAAILRAGYEAGHDLAALTSQISLTIALPADMFDAIAKLRAMRQMLTSLFSGLELDVPKPPQLIARPSLRMMSLLDPEENILRITTALLGGAIGGADAMAAVGHDYLSGESDEARRLVRMIQLMMIEESNLARSLDPACGSAFIEARTNDMANAAWKQFQTIEAEGGLAAFAESGSLVEWASLANATREEALRAGKTRLVGVTLQPTSDNPRPLAQLPEQPVRPAAVVETIRREMANNQPRLIILQAEKPSKAQLLLEKAVMKLLAVGGIYPVVIRWGADQVSTLAAVKPDVIISCLNNENSDHADNIPFAPPSGCQMIDSSALLADTDQLGRLRCMIAGRAK